MEIKQTRQINPGAKFLRKNPAGNVECPISNVECRSEAILAYATHGEAVGCYEGSRQRL